MPDGTKRYVPSPLDLVNQWNLVRNNFYGSGCFNNNWWPRYPGAWRAAAWGTAAAVFGAATWGACSSYCGYPAEPVYYDYYAERGGK